MKGIALNTVYGRLKALLEQEALPGDQGLLVWRMPTHLAISRRLGCSREMVTRLIVDLEHGGYVRTGDGHIALRKALPAKW